MDLVGACGSPGGRSPGDGAGCWRGGRLSSGVRAARRAPDGRRPVGAGWREAVHARRAAGRSVRLGAAAAGACLVLLALAGEAAAAVTLEGRAPRAAAFRSSAPRSRWSRTRPWSTGRRTGSGASSRCRRSRSTGCRWGGARCGARWPAWCSSRPRATWPTRAFGGTGRMPANAVAGGGRARSAWNHVGLAGGLSLAGIAGGTGRMMLGPWSRVRVIEQGYL